MNVIIVGGDPAGVYLAQMLLDKQCSVKVLENREAVVRKMRQDLPDPVIVKGSGTDPEILEAAGIAAADVFVATAGADEVNLVASTIAKFEFGVPRVIARINNPKNAWLFNAEMGVDICANQADLLAHLIVEGIDLKNMMTLLKINRGDASIIQVHVAPHSPAAGKKIRELDVPNTAVIICIFRGKENFIPRGDSQIEAEDDILALADESAQPIINAMFGDAE